MPWFEVRSPANAIFRVEAEDADKAKAAVQATLEDHYMQIPCGPHTIDFGNLKAEVWAGAGEATAEPASGPVKPFDRAGYMRMCLGQDDQED